MSTQTTDTTDNNSRLTMPYIDTTIDIGRGLTEENVFYFLPIAAAFLFTFIAYMVGLHAVAGFLLVFAGVSLSMFIYWEVTTPRYMTIGDRWKMSVVAMRLNRTFPWSHDNPRGRTIHEVEQFHSDGTAKMDDGRRVGLVKIEGMNTSQISRDEANSIVDQWTAGIDEDIRDFSWSIYATSTESDPEDVIKHYETRALGLDEKSHQPLGSRYIKDLLLDVSNWYIGVDSQKWSPSEWDFYIVLSVEPWEVKNTVTVEDPSRLHQLKNLIGMLKPSRSNSGPTITTDEELDESATIDAHDDDMVQSEADIMDDIDSRQQQAIDREQRAEVGNRIERVLTACSTIEGISAEPASTLDHARALINFWSGEEHTHGEEVLSAIANSDNRVRTNETPAEKMLSPMEYDGSDGRVKIGDQLCKTFCIMEWPTQPGALFLSDLFAVRNARVDVRIHVGNEHKQTVIEDTENIMANVGAEYKERLEETDVSAQQIQTDEQALKRMYHLLLNTTAQAWNVSAYVTVRVGPEEAADTAAATGRKFSSYEMAKIYALERACEKVTTILGKTPARCGLRTPQENVHQAFVSSSPTGTDQYNNIASTNQGTRMLGGAVAAMFPWATGTICEEEGLRFGRNKQNGTPVIADIFDREAAGHALSLGQTRSGKTYSVETALSEWYAAKSDNTLIVCDTEQGFTGLTKLLGGKHIKVDANSTINPHDIQPPSKLAQSGNLVTNNYQMKIDEVSNFYSGILRAQGIDPGPYRSTIEDAAQTTYRDAGITRDTATHSKESPTPQDFIDTLEKQLKDPGAYTFTDSPDEARRKKEVIADLFDKLTGLKEDGKYGHILGETDAGILDPDTNMIYIDLSAFSENSDAEKSVMLHLILGQIYQKVKKVHGESIFLIDEAHFLLHSDEMVEYLQDAARAWARYDAALWFITQSPREFLERAQSVESGQENQRRTILDQCSTISAFRIPRIEPELLESLGMNANQIRFIKKKAVIGNAGRGYAECLIHFQDRNGWWETHVEASPLQHYVWNYKPREHGDFDTYMQQFLQNNYQLPSTTDETDEPTPKTTDERTNGHTEDNESPAPSIDVQHSDTSHHND